MKKFCVWLTAAALFLNPAGPAYDQTAGVSPRDLSREGQDPQALKEQVVELASRQRLLYAQMRDRLKSIEDQHPELVVYYREKLLRLHEAKSLMKDAAELLEQQDLVSGFAAQARFFQEAVYVFVEGINYFRDEKEAKSMPIGTFLDREGEQVSYPKEKKMTVGRKPFFESQKFEKQKVVTHSYKEYQDTEPDEDTHLEAQEHRQPRKFHQKPESDPVEKSPGVEEGGSAGGGIEARKSPRKEPAERKELAAGRAERPGKKKFNTVQKTGGEVPEDVDRDPKTGKVKEGGGGAGAGAGAGGMRSNEPRAGKDGGLAAASGGGASGASSGAGGALAGSGHVQNGPLKTQLEFPPSSRADERPVYSVPVMPENLFVKKDIHSGRGIGLTQTQEKLSVSNQISGAAAGVSSVESAGAGSANSAGAAGASPARGSSAGGSRLQNSGAGVSTGSGEAARSSGSGDTASGLANADSGSVKQTIGSERAGAAAAASGASGSASSGSGNAGAGVSQGVGAGLSSGSGRVSEASGSGNALAGSGNGGAGSGNSAGAAGTAAGIAAGVSRLQNSVAGVSSGSGEAARTSGSGNAGAGDSKSAGAGSGNSAQTSGDSRGPERRYPLGSGAGSSGNAGAGGNQGTLPAARKTEQDSKPQKRFQSPPDQRVQGPKVLTTEKPALSGPVLRTAGKQPVPNLPQALTPEDQSGSGPEGLPPLGTAQATHAAPPRTAGIGAVPGREETQSRAREIRTETQTPHKKDDLVPEDRSVAAIREWLVQERLLIQELKKFKPVKQLNNPNPPWEFYLLRQRQLLDQLRQIRRRIEFHGKKDEYFMELRKLSKIANRLLDLLNAGEFTEYQISGTSLDDLIEQTASIQPVPMPASEPAPGYQASQEEELPEEYRAITAKYFERLSES